MVCPALVKVAVEADLTSEIAAGSTAGTVAVDGSEVTGVVDPDGRPWAVAVFLILPASRLAWVVA
jgi:hypothetical protein